MDLLNTLLVCGIKNKYRENEHIKLWSHGKLLTTEHFYHIGAKESNRNPMIEALVVNNFE